MSRYHKRILDILQIQLEILYLSAQKAPEKHPQLSKKGRFADAAAAYRAVIFDKAVPAAGST